MLKTTFNHKYILLVLLLCGSFVYGESQTLSSRQVKEYLTMAQSAHNGLQFSQAIDLYEKCKKENLNNTDLKNLADSYWQMRNYPKSMEVYEQLMLRSTVDFSTQERFRIGEMYARNGDYSQATKWLTGLTGFDDKVKAYKREAIKNMLVDSLVWKVSYLNINTPYREFSPMLYGNTLFFSSNRPLKTKQQAFSWDGRYFSRLWQVPVSEIKENGVAVPAANAAFNKKDTEVKKRASAFEGVDSKVSTQAKIAYMPEAYVKAYDSLPGSLVPGFDKIKYNSGHIAVDKDGMMYFSVNYPKANKQGDSKLLLAQGHYTGSGVENITALPFGENTYSVMHPAISQDGLIIVFSSDKGTGPGKFDLYYSRRISKNDLWRAPLVVPGQVNSNGNEVFPSITPDGYLYYSSDGKEGLGGLDIYRIKLDNALNGVGVPEHLPYPVNTTADDFGWTQTADGKTAYFSSDRTSSEDNIFEAKYDEAAANALALSKQKRHLEGFVLDRQTMQPMDNAVVFLWDKCSNKVYVTRADKDGKYSFVVTPKCDILVLGTGKGYGKDCYNLTVAASRETGNPIQKAPHDLLLDRYTKNLQWTLSDLRYTFNGYNMNVRAKQTLDSLVDILKNYPIKVELSSHTDSRGTAAYNDKLSQRRADAAKAYIVSRGIDANRIDSKGYGKQRLLNKCADGVPCSEAQHAMNRRTEIKVLIGPDSGMPDNFNPATFDIGAPLKPEQLPGGFFDGCK